MPPRADRLPVIPRRPLPAHAAPGTPPRRRRNRRYPAASARACAARAGMIRSPSSPTACASATAPDPAAHRPAGRSRLRIPEPCGRVAGHAAGTAGIDGLRRPPRAGFRPGAFAAVASLYVVCHEQLNSYPPPPRSKFRDSSAGRRCGQDRQATCAAAESSAPLVVPGLPPPRRPTADGFRFRAVCDPTGHHTPRSASGAAAFLQTESTAWPTNRDRAPRAASPARRSKTWWCGPWNRLRPAPRTGSSDDQDCSDDQD